MPATKLTRRQAALIRRLAGKEPRPPGTVPALAKRFGVTRQCIYVLLRGKTWRTK